MPIRTGRAMELTSHDILRIFKHCKQNGGRWEKYQLCPKCKGKGFRKDPIKPSSKVEDCPKCKSFGIIEKW